MALWLFKEEPGHYSYSQLEREGRTTWDGVRNALALRYLRQVACGDRVLFYHTGKEKAIIGEMKVLRGPSEEPPSSENQTVSVEVAAVRRLERPVPLARIKEDPVLANWDLVRLPRLSVVPVTEEQWQRIETLSRS
jgi:predicted RNA-binding protein with PUA-like domain